MADRMPETTGFANDFPFIDDEWTLWENTAIHAARDAANNVRFERDAIRDYLRLDPAERPPGLKWWPPDLRLGRSELCTPCRAIDFEAAFTTPRAYSIQDKWWINTHEQDTGSFNQIERNSMGVDWPVNSNCQLCRYFANAVRSSPEKGIYTIVFHNESQSHHDEVLIEVLPYSLQQAEWYAMPQTNHWQFGSTFGRGLGADSFDNMRSASNTIICHRNIPVRNAGSPQIVSPGFDTSLAKLWVETCKRQHAACGLNDDEHMPKTRLIDCITRRLVSVDSSHPRPSFVALSYTWGAVQSESPQNITDELSTDLPLTIEDSITVTTAIGLQYLWVDQYCIDQGDEKDKKTQIQQMDRIYKCADLTIIAAAGDGRSYGLPGVSARRRDVLEPFVVDDVFTFGIHPQEDFQYWKKGAWHTRGWTFQEAQLSRRLLVFSDTAMYYECRGGTDQARQSELCGGIECANFEGSQSFNSRPRVNGPGVESVVGSNTLSSAYKLGGDWRFESTSHQGLLESFLTYINLVTQYTTRNLKFASDALDAFRGAANALHPVYSISGVPFLVPDQAELEDGLIENSFLRGLAWRSTTGGAVAPSPHFPSWSWANMRVWNVTWICIDEYQKTDLILSQPIHHAHGMQIEFNGKKEPYAFAQFAKACRNPTPLSPFTGNPTALCFKSRIFCSRFTSEYLDYDEESYIGNAYSDLGEDIPDIFVRVDVGSAHQQIDESGGARQVHHYQRGSLTQISDERLCEKLVSHKYSLVLLHFDSAQASVLLVEWLEDEPDGHQRTARRVGIVNFTTFYRHGVREEDQNNTFLQCFSIEVDLRLI